MIVTIRHAKVEDAHVIAEAEREIAKEAGFFCSQPSELTNEKVINTILSFIKDKMGIYLVAEYEGQIVGHAFLEPFQLQSLSHVAELNIAVHLGWHRKGIGTKLLERIIGWAIDSGILEKIQLNVRASNSRAIALYKKMGFKEEGRLKNRIKIKDHYIDDVIMGLDLIHNRVKAELDIPDSAIQTMQKKDIENLVKIFCFPWSSVQATSEKWKRYYTEHEKCLRTVYLLEKQGKIIGYASLLRLSGYLDFKNTGIPEIHDVWISKEWRHEGFGKMLVLHLEDIARKEGYTQIGLGVALYGDYGPAQQLYFNLGYTPDGRGVTYKYQFAIPGETYPLDDELILWLKKYLLYELDNSSDCIT